jgi:hypothetical protein
MRRKLSHVHFEDVLLWTVTLGISLMAFYYLLQLGEIVRRLATPPFYAISSFTTKPCTSVRRKSLPE